MIPTGVVLHGLFAHDHIVALVETGHKVWARRLVGGHVQVLAAPGWRRTAVRRANGTLTFPDPQLVWLP